MEFDEYYVVFLWKGPTWTSERTERLSKLQEEHLAFQRKLHEDGITMAHGPFDDPHPDKERRGIIIMRVNGRTPEEALEILSGDPMVEAEHLALEVVPWYTGKGVLKADNE